MSGLVGYDSSDDDENTVQSGNKSPQPSISGKPDNFKASGPPGKEVLARNIQSDDTLSRRIGPVTGPTIPEVHRNQELQASSTQTSDQDLLMNLTLPPIPNFDIPESPPGSPDVATSAKLAQFAELKRQGIYFNERLASSTAIKNPNLFSKLLSSFEIKSEDQYATSVPLALWDPACFPTWAYKEELAQAQSETRQKGESQPMDTGRVEFVPVAEKQVRTSREKRR